MNTFYITTPIYYVNDTPHIGHAYTTVLAEVLAGYHRLLGTDTFFVTGTDEHGQKVARAARQNGVVPQVQADRTVSRFHHLWDCLRITPDDFIRTTEDRHVQVVREALRRLHAQGDIYQGSYDGSYCVSCEQFVTGSPSEGSGCPDCGTALESVREDCWFFRQSAYQPWLIDHIEQHPSFLQPEHRRKEILGFLRNPLRDLCVSRPVSRLDWGVPLPFDERFVCYVWFDALLNYVTAAGWPDDPFSFEQLWPADCYLVGKDILTTHAVYWPIILKALDLPPPEAIFAHGMRCRYCFRGVGRMGDGSGGDTEGVILAILDRDVVQTRWRGLVGCRVLDKGVSHPRD